MNALFGSAFKRPVLTAVAGLVAGMVLASNAAGMPWPVYVAGGAGGLVAWFALRRPGRWAALPLGVVFFFGGAAYWEAWHAGAPGDAFARDVAAQPERTGYVVEGRVAAADIWLAGRSYSVVIVEVDRAQRREEVVALSGRTLLRWSEPGFPVYVGDRVRVRGEPSLALSHVNPGASGPEDHYRRRGVHSSIRVYGSGSIEVVTRAPWYDVWAGLSRFRGSLAERLERAVPASSLPLVLTVWLGDRRQIDSELYREFVESGTAHILAVSGLHVAIIFASLRAMLRMGIRRRRARLFVTMLSLVAVVGMTGGSVSTLRATIMIGIYLVAEWFEREPDAPTALSIAAGLFLVHDPDMLYDVAFQLSFLSVASLLLFDQGIGDWLGRLPMAVREGVSATLAVQILPLPVAAHAFHVVPLLATVVNLIVIPLTGVVLWLGFLTSVFALVLPPVAPLFGHALHPFAQSILGIATFLGRSDRVHVEVTSPTVLALGLYAIAAFAVYGLLRQRRARRLVWLCVAGSALVGSLLAWSPVRPRAEVTVLDVGHGDSIFVRAPGGATMLVDAGLRAEHLDEGERTVAPFLWSNHESKLDVLMLTHPDSDHIGGATYILEHFRVGSVVLGPEPFGGTLEDDVLAACERRGVPVRRLARGDAFDLGGARVEILHPTAQLRPGMSENDRSLVARVRWDGFSMLLTGDVERQAEQQLIGLGPRASVIKVPHHGSITSSSEAFIDAVQPSVAVVSVGARGRRSVLSPEVVGRYASRGVTVLRTDVVGGVRIRPLSDARIRVEPARLERGYITRE